MARGGLIVGATLLGLGGLALWARSASANQEPEPTLPPPPTGGGGSGPPVDTRTNAQLANEVSAHALYPSYVLAAQACTSSDPSATPDATLAACTAATSTWETIAADVGVPGNRWEAVHAELVKQGKWY